MTFSIAKKTLSCIALLTPLLAAGCDDSEGSDSRDAGGDPMIEEDAGALPDAGRSRRGCRPPVDRTRAWTPATLRRRGIPTL